MYWLGEVSLAWLYCSVCNIVAAAVCLQGCSVCIGRLLLALHGCTVVYAILWLLPFAYKAAMYALAGCCQPYTATKIPFIYSISANFGNWDSGRPIPFLGIFVSNFRYWLFVVHGCNVVYAILWLLPFAYKVAVYALVGCG
jgi:hypothetical protein